MVLATVSPEGQPWSTPVFFAYDASYNFYWYSRNDTRHSENIAKHKQVSAVVFGVNNQDEGYGVYLEGVAGEVAEEELGKVMEVYAAKAGTNEEEKRQLMTKEDFLGESPIRMYAITPKKMYVSNESIKWNGKWIDSRSEILFNK
jgi:nitroimidazol reductase NimA-like FMN-containing flavoprotein (pyridoxamine 5'-phosphate oxidase superfamily)